MKTIGWTSRILLHMKRAFTKERGVNNMVAAERLFQERISTAITEIKDDSICRVYLSSHNSSEKRGKFKPARMSSNAKIGKPIKKEEIIDNLIRNILLGELIVDLENKRKKILDGSTIETALIGYALKEKTGKDSFTINHYENGVYEIEELNICLDNNLENCSVLQGLLYVLEDMTNFSSDDFEKIISVMLLSLHKKNPQKFRQIMELG